MKHLSPSPVRVFSIALLAAALAACASTAAPTSSNPTAAPAATSAAVSSSNTSDTAASAATAAAAKLNLNTATADDFLTVPAVGSRMVREFMEYRPYTSITQFRREIGKYVDDAQVAAFEQYVYVPVDVNQADAATLQQIPGVDAAVAADLIAGRPYADSAAFLAQLSTHLTAEQVDTAKSYLAG